jgi:ureidoglycolate hydrolase
MIFNLGVSIYKIVALDKNYWHHAMYFIQKSFDLYFLGFSGKESNWQKFWTITYILDIQMEMWAYFWYSCFKSFPMV